MSADQKTLFGITRAALEYEHVQGGNVPGGHNVICSKSGPFVPPTRGFSEIALRHSDIYVDIGAYVGTYAIRCARFPVKLVRAYEPTQYTFDLLSLSALPNLELHRAAVVGDESTTVELFVSRGIGCTNSIVKSHRKVGVEVVPAIRYELATNGASVVKVDVEGGEYDFALSQPNLRALIIDFHPMPGDWIARASAIIEGFERDGFEALVSPDWSCGWTQSGTWIRPRETEGEFEPMMSGSICCGCGASIEAKRKALCDECWNAWSPRHRESFERTARVDDER